MDFGKRACKNLSPKERPFVKILDAAAGTGKVGEEPFLWDLGGFPLENCNDELFSFPSVIIGIH